MRYFLVFERQAHREARQFLSAGMLAPVLTFVLSVFVPAVADWVFLMDLLACVLLFSGVLMMEGRKMRRESILFAAAFAFRLGVAFLRPRGLFSFLTYVPFSACVLIGEVLILDRMMEFLRGRAEERERETLQRAQRALVRSEVSFWGATLISYLSDLLIFPALLMFVWAIGIRVWVSVLMYRSPRFLSSRLFFEERSARSQVSSS